MRPPVDGAGQQAVGRAIRRDVMKVIQHQGEWDRQAAEEGFSVIPCEDRQVQERLGRRFGQRVYAGKCAAGCAAQKDKKTGQISIGRTGLVPNDAVATIAQVALGERGLAVAAGRADPDGRTGKCVEAFVQGISVEQAIGRLRRRDRGRLGGRVPIHDLLPERRDRDEVVL